MWHTIGQGRAVSLLERSLATGAVAHAYLFVGPAHVGKMTLALEMAQALNCNTPQVPCGECVSCRRIAALKHADVLVIQLEAGNEEGEERGKKAISVEQLEELQHAANLPPFEGRCRVFIIDGAEYLSSGAANRLLKTLEEPPANVVFILLVASVKLLPETVASRCQRVDVVPLPVTAVEAALGKWGVNDEKARLLARISHGCLGKAVSFVQDERLLRQHNERIDALVSAVRSGNDGRFASAAQLAARYSQNREAVYQELDLWLDWWRDVMLVRLGVTDMVSNLDRIEELKLTAAGCNLAQVKDCIRSIQEAGRQLRQNASPRLVLEAMMLRVPETNKD